MALLAAALGFLLAGAALALAAGRRERCAATAALGGLLGAAATGLPAAAMVIARGETLAASRPWSVPLGSASFGLDPLSAWFLLPILTLGALAGLYGAGYLRAWRGRNLGACWACYLLLVACMVLVVAARNAVLFLVAWETMALASYALVMFEDHRADVRRAGRTYLIATHLGTGALLALFALLGQPAGSLDFADLSRGAAPPALLFALAMVGFGAKAGFVPLHVWLPEAHPASPSHVSALMSGVMIKTGVYGLLRILPLLGPPPPAWGWTLLAVGAVSGVFGVLFALAQHDLKRLLAYHSVENVGIIALGLGLGLLGRAYDAPAVAWLGFAGALLHVVNHALFKGLLFLGAGAVAQAAGTREIDRLGGLLRRLPWTGATFLVGAAAICGLPPLNGFVSEFLIFSGALAACVAPHPAGAAAGAVAMGALGLIGGLAAACFAKAFGIVFLGEPRTARAATAAEVGRPLRAAMVVLAIACVAIGLLAPLAVGALTTVVTPLAGAGGPAADAVAALRRVVLVGAVALAALAVLAGARRALLARRAVATGPTWDCGFAAPTARMQDTAAGFAEPLTSLFGSVLRPRRSGDAVAGFFPARASLATATPDPALEGMFEPALRAVARLCARRRWVQGGPTQRYVLYIVVTLLVLVAWKLS